MRRLVFAIIMAILFFVLLNFIYCNLDAATFSYRLIFKFDVPYIISLKSAPIPLGFILLIVFSAGMITIALLEALPSLFKTLEIRAKNKRIRQLERELSVVRKVSEKREEDASRASLSESDESA
ncbi:MAG: LapA family protein [Pseudomonadota bacterium]